MIIFFTQHQYIFCYKRTDFVEKKPDTKNIRKCLYPCLIVHARTMLKHWETVLSIKHKIHINNKNS